MARDLKVLFESLQKSKEELKKEILPELEVLRADTREMVLRRPGHDSENLFR
jgi:hypothetical protein